MHTSVTASELNQSMGRVYGYMFLATTISMAVSMFVGFNTHLVSFFFTGVMKWIVTLAPVAFILIVPMLINSGIGYAGKILTLATFASLMGLSSAIIFAVYTLGSIFGAFMGASVLFGVISGYGFFTKRSLDSFGKWLIAGLISIIIVSIINIFIGSTALQMAISAIAVAIFLGLTAYDTQKIREMLSDGSSESDEILCALTLYLDFINIFINLLELFGNKKD